ncbi:GGDEF domain-containing protein [Aquifex pyrophilus]
MEKLRIGNYETLYDLWKRLREEYGEEEALKVVNNISKELIVKEAKKDKYVFEKVLIKELLKDSRRERYIKEKLLWTIRFLRDVINLSAEPSVELNYRNCFLWRDLMRLRKQRLKERFLREILETHKTVHVFAKKFYESLKEENYISAYFYYQNCVKNSYALISLLSAVRLKEVSEELKKDPLTGLLNRRFLIPIFEDVLELSMYTELPFSVAIIDLDDFKKINDTYGHLVGDCVLKNVAKIIRKNLRKSDYIFRYGGEEFLVLLPSTGLEDAVNILEKLRRAVERTEIECEGHKINVTVSIGVCSDIYTGDKSPEDYINCADQKLYEAKKEGKNRVIF